MATTIIMFFWHDQPGGGQAPKGPEI